MAVKNRTPSKYTLRAFSDFDEKFEDDTIKAI